MDATVQGPHYLLKITSKTKPPSNAAPSLITITFLSQTSSIRSQISSPMIQKPKSLSDINSHKFLDLSILFFITPTHSSSSLPQQPSKPQTQPTKTPHHLTPTTSNSHTPNESLLLSSFSTQTRGQKALLPSPLPISILQFPFSRRRLHYENKLSPPRRPQSSNVPPVTSIRTKLPKYHFPKLISKTFGLLTLLGYRARRSDLASRTS